MAQVAEIKLEDLRKVKNALKKLSNSWAKKIATKLFPEETEERALDRVYNILSGSSGRDQETRINFINAANELKTELESGQQVALSNLQNITK